MCIVHIGISLASTNAFSISKRIFFRKSQNEYIFLYNNNINLYIFIHIYSYIYIIFLVEHWLNVITMVYTKECVKAIPVIY